MSDSSSLTGSYYFWKWAENDLPGQPVEIHAALLRGELHPALQTFDARPLVKKLERAGANGRKHGDEWDWQITPREDPKRARFVFVTCPEFGVFQPAGGRFLKSVSSSGLSGCDDQDGQLISGLRPKLNLFTSGQLPGERLCDITPGDLPYLLRRIDRHRRDPYAILQDRRGYFVQCRAQGRRFIVEWAQNGYRRGKTEFDQWRAQDPSRLAALGGVNEEPQPANKEPDFIRYADTLRIFQAFLRGEPRPPQYAWRNINHIFS